MKPASAQNPAVCRAGASRAFTLPEMMVTMSIFGLTLMAMLSSHLFGLRQDQLVRSKLGASDEARASLNRLVQEIQSAKVIFVGEGSAEDFRAIADGTAQVGNALHIQSGTNASAFVRYFFDRERRELLRVENGIEGSRVMAAHLSADSFFRSENHLGMVRSNYVHNPVIACHLEFEQFQYPLTRVGPGYYYDSYQMNFRVTRRAHD